jgi:gluconate 2-dehydrogenase gamma chain
MNDELSRRRFLSQAGAAVSAVWVSANWPQMLAAATHAHNAAESAQTIANYKFEFFTREEAAEVDAMASRIIPTDETPGAHEAGVVYFIDRALVTFASDDGPKYRAGLPEVQKLTRETFAAVERFSAATAEQQDQILSTLDEQKTGKGPGRRRAQGSVSTFFDVVRVHTISGFLIDPETSNGNRGGVGWKLIGREQEHMFKPPFGYYDKDYPGWQPAGKTPEKT